MNTPQNEARPHGLFGDELNIDIQHYIRTLRKYKWQILGLTALITGLAVFYAISATPIYRATATLLIESQKANVVSIEEIYGFDGANEEYYQTQFELLKSRALAEKVIDRLDLANNPDFAGDKSEGGGLSGLLSKLGLSGAAETAGSLAEGVISADISTTTLPESPTQASAAFEMTELSEEEKELQQLVDKFMRAMSIEPVRRTQLVKISFESPNPLLAATVANTIGDTYIESYLDAKMEMTQKAAEWLSDRLGGLQMKLDESEQKLIAFREEHQLIDVNGTVGKLNEQQVTIATTELSAAQRELAETESLYREVTRLRETSPELLDTIPAVQRDPLVQSFKLELDKQQRELDELSNRYGARHPKIVDAQSRLNVINQSLNRQMDRVISAIRSDYEVASQKVASLNRTLATGKAEIQDINKKKFELAALEREVEANRKLYDTFFNRIRETSETDGLEAANARVSDRAVPPSSAAKPKKSLIVALAMITGLIGSVLLAFLREHMDDTIKGTDEIESRLNTPLLGIIPLVKAGILARKRKIPLSPLTLEDKKGTFSESIRTIRTSVCLDSMDHPHKRIVVTSSIPGEGKSTLSANLAHSLAQLESVVIIDADMRRPTVGKTFEIDPKHKGLSDYLSSGSGSSALKVQDCIVRKVGDTNLDVMPCGSLPENPLELLASARFSALLDELEQTYDRVVIDCAPTQAVSDALVVGKQADAVIFCVKSHDTSLNLVRRSLQRLAQVKAHVLGVAVTQVDVDKISSYGGDYYYQGYYDYYGYSDNKKAKDASKSKGGKKASAQA
ncbi:polysaccharide biosynthesis tyrosine autokinase [Granulosicoccaceae sp. 1_MG-2023]|nr:polysaccharide biosynthesis tyrosine autokinase [Granulosicoccaceae sp. 1_MG-2023]